MERRSNLRVSVDQAVHLTSLGPNRQVIAGKAVDLSGGGIQILLPVRIAPGQPVRIDLEDALLLGEICYCHQVEGGFMAGVQLDQALNGLAGLARLHSSLLGQDDKRETGALSYSVSEQV